jgi:hypothetical protein
MPGPLGILGNNSSGASGGGILSQQGGIIGRLTGGAGAGGASGGGILSNQMNLIKSRRAAWQAGGTLDAKLAAVGSTLGTRVRNLSSQSGAATPPPTAPPAQAFGVPQYAVGGQQTLSLIPPTSSGRFA